MVNEAVSSSTHNKLKLPDETTRYYDQRAWEQLLITAGFDSEAIVNGNRTKPELRKLMGDSNDCASIDLRCCFHRCCSRCRDCRNCRLQSATSSRLERNFVTVRQSSTRRPPKSPRRLAAPRRRSNWRQHCTDSAGHTNSSSTAAWKRRARLRRQATRQRRVKSCPVCAVFPPSPVVCWLPPNRFSSTRMHRTPEISWLLPPGIRDEMLYKYRPFKFYGRHL